MKLIVNKREESACCTCLLTDSVKKIDGQPQWAITYFKTVKGSQMDDGWCFSA
jgi:hypothetical protein